MRGSDAASAGSEGGLLRTIAAGTANVTGRGFFRSLVRHLGDALHAEVAFIAEFLDERGERARVLASWSGEGVELAEGHEFPVPGSPCELTLERDVVTLPDGVCRAYPADPIAARHGLDSYLAIVLRGSGGDRLGYVGVQARRRLEASEEELAALAIFASRAAAEIERRRHEVALREREAEVAASRAGMVTAADDERRRIGRNLHDGTQQRLVALGHLLKMARARIESAPDVAAELLERSQEEVEAAFGELQDLSRGLHPTALAENGLAHALTALANRSPIPLRIVAMPERRLPEVLEVTLYYLVSEALTNAIKHSGAAELRVEVHQRGRQLLAQVEDDGVGGADAHGGTGLAGLTGRLEALGGRLDTESPPGGGTRLTASIPLSPWRDAREPFLEYGFEGDDGFGRELIDAIVAGRKTAGISLARDWNLEGGPPRVGQRLPVMDHEGHLHAEVEVLAVSIEPFGRVSHEVLVASGTDDRTPEEWRAAQRAYYDDCRDEVAMLFGEPGWRFSDEEPVVVLRFRRVA